MRAKTKKKPNTQLEKMLLRKIPETPVPEPYFTIPSPQPERFPLSETLLEGVKLLEHYEPDETNQRIRSKLPNSRIERMIRFRDVFCMMGKGGNGLLVDDQFLDVRGATAFDYGPMYLLVAFEDRRLEVYTSNRQLKLVKSLKNFSADKITFLKILSTPKTCESIIFLSCSGKKLSVHRLEKSFFSTLSQKLCKPLLTDLQYPVTQIMEIPLIFRYYLRKDKEYKDCSLVAVSAVNRIYILRVNHFRINMDDFITIDHIRKHEEVTTNTVSWGQAMIEAPSRFISGEKLILTYSFGDLLYFLALREVEKFIGGEIIAKYEWVESHPFIVDEGKVAFCQYMKKNQILLITEDNEVIIFHTNKFPIFQKEIHTKQIDTINERFGGNLEARKIWTLHNKTKQPELQMTNPNDIDITEQQLDMINQTPLITYADTFEYEYPSNEIFFLTEKKFSIYMYCDWKIIANIMKVEQKYQSAMLFLIAIYKKANIFDLGVEGSQADLSQYIQMLAIEYINNKLSKIKSMPEIIQSIVQNRQFFKMIITPIEFLTETNEFTFLFEIVKDKIISALIVNQTKKAYEDAEIIFYEALMKFIEHGRIKYIPEEKLQETLKYFADTDNLGMIDRLAVYFDLNRIDRNILIQSLLHHNLVVSLAHVCTQGNQSQFVTPFVKFWGISENYRIQKKDQYAKMFAIRALWYVQLCLQRNWALKEYSFDKYAGMIRVLSEHFLTERIITGLLQIKPEYCLETLGFYFTIQNSQIVSEQNRVKLKLKNVEKVDWILEREGFEQLELLLSAISTYLLVALKNRSQSNSLFNLFLSSLIIYKTVKFTEKKYLQILQSLIEHYEIIQSMKYGLEEKTIESFKETYDSYDYDEIDRILASRYINKILTLVFYECHYYFKDKLHHLYSKASEQFLTDLQAQLTFLQGNYRRCIEIYVRARPPSNLLVFQFLENSFKRLLLEKKIMEKKKLASCITEQIKWMVNLDPRKTMSLVQVYIPEVQEDLIFALKSDEDLQLQFLEGIVQDENLVQMKNNLSQESINQYVKLMSTHKKEKLLEVLKKNSRFTTEDTLRICEKGHVYDCMEYLYERMGNIIESVKIASFRIDEILMSRALGEDDQYEEAPYIKIKQILDNSIDVCRKNHSEEIWESLLDSFILLYSKYEQNEKFPREQLEVFFYINGEIMENLASNCPISHTIDLLQNKYTTLNMGGKMTRAFTNILSNLSHSINILYIATNLIQDSLHNTLMSEYEKKLHSYSTPSVCEACGFGLIKTAKSLHFKCGHSYHAECMVSKEQSHSPICVSCLKHQSDQFEYYLNTLNPLHPKVKKIREVMEKFDEKKLLMSETFRIEEFQKIQSAETLKKKKKQTKKIEKMQNFDESVFEIQSGDRRVLSGLRI